MDLEQRVQVLEQEVQVLKNQIQATLLEMQEYLLTNAHPSLRAEDTPRSSSARPPSAGIRKVSFNDEDEPADEPHGVSGVRKVSLNADEEPAPRKANAKRKTVRDDDDNEWTIGGIYANAKLGEGETYDPGIINPGEEVIFQVNLASALGSRKTIQAVFVTPNGVSAPTQFTRNDPPVLTVNTGIQVAAGGIKPITATQLSTTDPDDELNDLIYTVLAGPTKGTLSLGSTFTQLAINNGMLNYTRTSVAIWKGLPSLSFTLTQNSYSSHTSIEGRSNITNWRYVLNNGPQTYRIEVTRTDGNIEYDLVVTDSNGKPVATTKSSDGNAVIMLTTGRGCMALNVNR